MVTVIGGTSASIRAGRGGRVEGGEGERHAGVEPFDFPDPGAGLAPGVLGAVVARAQVGEAGGAVADEEPGDLADDPGDRDDGFLLAAAPGYPPVLLAEAGIGPGRCHHALAERGAQVRVALAGAAGLRAGAGLEGARGQPGPRGGVSRTACGGTNERRSIARSFSLHSHTQSSRSLLPRPGRCLASLALTSHTSRPAASAR